jgi:DNA-binding MarR family transcriptional regulator
MRWLRSNIPTSGDYRSACWRILLQASGDRNSCYLAAETPSRHRATPLTRTLHPTALMKLPQLRSHYAAVRFYRMNLTQSEALCAVAEHGSATVGAISAQIKVTTASFTHVGDALTLLGYIKRRAGTSDRRTIWLDITPLGSAVVRNILRGTQIPVDGGVASPEADRMAAAR